MESDSAVAVDDRSEVLFQWSARKLSPVVLIYVALVFVALIAICHFVFHSPAAVKALAMTAVASMVPLVPTILQRVEYRMIETGLEKRLVAREEEKEFEPVFAWSELERVAPVSRGLKYYKPLNEANPIRRFWKLHLSDEYSGEILVEKADQAKVLELLERYQTHE